MEWTKATRVYNGIAILICYICLCTVCNRFKTTQLKGLQIKSVKIERNEIIFKHLSYRNESSGLQFENWQRHVPFETGL